MPLRPIRIDKIVGQSTDRSPVSPETAVLQQLSGLVPGPVYGGTNFLVSADGSELLTTRPLTNAPTQGATGEPTVTSQMWDNSDPDTMTLFMTYSYLVKGNILGNVINGNGSNLFSKWAGKQGVVVSCTNELWGGAPLMDAGAASYESDAGDIEEVAAGLTVLCPQYNGSAEFGVLDSNQIFSWDGESENFETSGQYWVIWFGQDFTGNQWYGVQSGTTLTIYMVASGSTEWSVVGAIRDFPDPYDLQATGQTPLVYWQASWEGTGAYFLVSVQTSTTEVVRLFKADSNGVNRVGTTGFGLTWGTSSGNYRTAQGLSWNSDFDLVFFATVDDGVNRNKLYVVKVDPETGDVRANYPADTGLVTQDTTTPGPTCGPCQFYNGFVYFPMAYYSSGPKGGVFRIGLDDTGISVAAAEVFNIDAANIVSVGSMSIENATGDISVADGVGLVYLWTGGSPGSLATNSGGEGFFSGQDYWSGPVPMAPLVWFNREEGGNPVWLAAGIHYVSDDTVIPDPDGGTSQVGPVERACIRFWNDAGTLIGDKLFGYLAPFARFVSASPAQAAWTSGNVTITVEDWFGNDYVPNASIVEGVIVEIFTSNEISLRGTVVSAATNTIVILPSDYVADPSAPNPVYFGPGGFRTPIPWANNNYVFDPNGYYIQYVNSQLDLGGGGGP